MDVAVALVLLVGLVAVGSALAERLGVPSPLLLVVGGFAVSLVPAMPEYELEPEVVLVGILPPLLYAAALRTSLIDLRRDRRAIALLSVGAVVFTCLIVGYIASWIVPGLPLAAAFALGAIVAPPDAVAATAIARRVGMPRRIVNILEGESLVNDATALVALSTSVGALAGEVSAASVGYDFLIAAGGGIVVGLVVAAVFVAIRRHLDDVVLGTAVSLLVPFVAFLAAEELSISGTHPSGVLAVVITGVILGQRSIEQQSATARLTEDANWRTVQFVLENAVFLLIGLQLRSIIEDAADSDLGWGRLVGICAVVLVATIVVRFVWVYPATYLPRRLFASIAEHDPSPPWTYPFVVSWAGMRGVVTLAAAASLPTDVPQRPALVLAAFTVVAGTLLLQGSTLPGLVRRLGLPGPDAAEDAIAAADALQSAANAGIARLDELAPDLPDDVVQRAREKTLDRANRAWERLGGSADTPSESYQRARLEMLAAEREELGRIRDEGRLDEEVLRELQRLLDIEESMLDQFADSIGEVDRARARGAETRACEHLRHRWPDPDVEADAVCERCVAEGTTWVHLRVCLACANVACCDSSPSRHAHAHFVDSDHPVMRSAEPGEAWRWCYVDDRLG